MKNILKFDLKYLSDIKYIQVLVSEFYKKTGYELNLNFNGSKGYLYDIEFRAEGFHQQPTNKLLRSEILTQERKYRKKIVHLNWSEAKGVVIELKNRR